MCSVCLSTVELVLRTRILDKIETGKAHYGLLAPAEGVYALFLFRKVINDPMTNVYPSVACCQMLTCHYS
jgi:hypothetical protein